jgi:hypothetical protein
MSKISDKLKEFSFANQPNIPKELFLQNNPYKKNVLTEKDIFNIDNWKIDAQGMMQYNTDHLNTEQIKQTIQTLRQYDLHPLKIKNAITVLDEVHLLKQCEKAHPERPPIAMTEEKIYHNSIPLFSKNLPILKMGKNFEVDLKDILTPSRMQKLEQGSVILIGRDVTAQKNLPPELKECSLHGLNLTGADINVSRLQGYLFFNNKRLYYTDCSSNGTIVKQHKKKETELNFFKIYNSSRSA